MTPFSRAQELIRKISALSGVDVSAELSESLVRAVLTTYREATMPMLEAGISCADREAQRLKLSTCQGVWRTMLNTALEER